mmetsp:Transcript_49078/g.116815  ORF Transcript_49078/g.116815 Transcript_49078/m.116815 type:complete len:270 (-) Transcript_49078:113-922(-)
MPRMERLTSRSTSGVLCFWPESFDCGLHRQQPRVPPALLGLQHSIKPRKRITSASSTLTAILEWLRTKSMMPSVEASVSTASFAASLRVFSLSCTFCSTLAKELSALLSCVTGASSPSGDAISATVFPASVSSSAEAPATARASAASCSAAASDLAALPRRFTIAPFAAGLWPLITSALTCSRCTISSLATSAKSAFCMHFVSRGWPGTFWQLPSEDKTPAVAPLENQALSMTSKHPCEPARKCSMANLLHVNVREADCREGRTPEWVL